MTTIFSESMSVGASRSCCKVDEIKIADRDLRPVVPPLNQHIVIFITSCRLRPSRTQQLNFNKGERPWA